jgi:hypothetical protein
MLKLEQVSRYSNNFRFRSYCQNSSNCCGHNYDQSISRIFRSNFDENNRFKVITYVPKDIQFKKINLRGTMRTLRFLSLLSARWPAAQSPIVNLGVWWDISWKFEKKIVKFHGVKSSIFETLFFLNLLLEVVSFQLVH